MSNFNKEFNTLNYVIKEADSILLFAHSRPDSDTVGAVLALDDYIKKLGKISDIGCYDAFPEHLTPIISSNFISPNQLDFKKYNLIIACDSVERGFHKIKNLFGENQVIALLDHHPDITIKGDINIIDPVYSSVCEIVYDFFAFNKIAITKLSATCILLGIMGDTGMFQHSNTTAKIMEISSALMKKGAPLTKIVETVFAKHNPCALKLWGKAFEKAKINPKNGMIASVITSNELAECNAGTDDIAQVAGILNTVPGTKFSLILSEREGGIVKGSLRSEEYKGVDVSKIAAQFGGGGHKLASGFEVKGKIYETEDGWEIV